MSESKQKVAPPDASMLLNYHCRLAAEYLAKSRRQTLAVRTPEEWEARRKSLVAEFERSIGPFPERTSLNARITGTIERPDMVIENIIFESRPGYYVTSNLYLPKNPESVPYPAALVLLGHWSDGKNAGPQRELALTLAQKGVAALVLDPIGQGERRMALDAQGKPIYGPTTEHCIMGFPCLLTGANVLQYFLWDAIRAIDYLYERPEIDKTRIAVTGASGGGTQTSHLAPIEPRAVIAAPTAYLNARLMFMESGNAEDAEQSQFGILKAGIDHSTLIKLAAPRPYQVQAAIRDFFPIAGTRQSVEAARHVYRILGAEENLRLVEVDDEHGYMPGLRMHFYEFVNRWFEIDADSDEPPVEPNTREELLCTPTGQVRTSFADAPKWVADFNRERAEEIAPRRPLPTGVEEVARYQNTVRTAMREALPLPEVGKPVIDHRSSEQAGDTVTEIILIQTEPGITVTGLIVRPAAEGKHPAALLITETGNDAAEAVELRNKLVSRGFVTMSIEVRGVGASAPGPVPDPKNLEYFLVASNIATQAQNASKLGTSIFQGRLLDTLQCFMYLGERPDVDAKRVAVIGWDEAGLVALTAAALDTKIAACAQIGSLATYISLAGAEMYAHPPTTFVWNVLTHYDLPEAAACVAPRPLLLSNLVGPMKESLPLNEIESMYGAARAAYDASQSDALRLDTSDTDVADWITEALGATFTNL